MVDGWNKGENVLVILFMCGFVKKVRWFGLTGMY